LPRFSASQYRPADTPTGKKINNRKMAADLSKGNVGHDVVTALDIVGLSSAASGGRIRGPRLSAEPVIIAHTAGLRRVVKSPGSEAPPR
jgi:hypothetical protein